MIFDMTKRKSGGGGESDPYEIARKLVANTLTEYRDEQAESIASYAFYNRSNLEKCIMHNVIDADIRQAFSGTTPASRTKVRYLAFPKITRVEYLKFGYNADLLGYDFTQVASIAGGSFIQANSLKTLILRKADAVVTLGNISAFNTTPFASDGSGGTLYIPKALYDHLGDGTAMDYKAATNWSTILAYANNTVAQIEGSEYENTYIDGEPIPSE